MKKFTTLFLVFILALALFLPMGCENYEKKFYTLDEVYENGEITRQNLLSIIYYINGGIIEENKEQYPEDFVPTPKDPEKLDEQTQNMIAKVYKNEWGYKNEWQHNVFYYGTYDDYIAVVVEVQEPNVAYPESIEFHTIDGVGYWWTYYYGKYIYLYKNY